MSCRAGISRFRRWAAKSCGFIFASIFVSGFAVNVIKLTVGRARLKLYFEKCLFGIDPPGHDAAWRSIPSGHASTVTASALAAGFLLPRYRVNFLIDGELLASTRVLVNAHFESGVIFGGAATLYVTAYLHRRFATKKFAFRALNDSTIESKPEARIVSLSATGGGERFTGRMLRPVEQ